MAESNREVVRISVNQEKMDFEQNIIMNVMEFNLQADQVLSTAKADTIAQLGYDVTQQRFLIGKVDVTKLNLARNDQEKARRAYINALRSYWNYYYTIRQLTLFDFEKRRRCRKILTGWLISRELQDVILKKKSIIGIIAATILVVVIALVGRKELIGSKIYTVKETVFLSEIAVKGEIQGKDAMQITIPDDLKHRDLRINEFQIKDLIEEGRKVKKRRLDCNPRHCQHYPANSGKQR